MQGHSHPLAVIYLFADVVAGLAVFGSYRGYLPDIAAACAIVYYLFQASRWVIWFFQWVRGVEINSDSLKEK